MYSLTFRVRVMFL